MRCHEHGLPERTKAKPIERGEAARAAARAQRGGQELAADAADIASSGLVTSLDWE
jgi:hypothetical protein